MFDAGMLFDRLFAKAQHAALGHHSVMGPISVLFQDVI